MFDYVESSCCRQHVVVVKCDPPYPPNPNFQMDILTENNVRVQSSSANCYHCLCFLDDKFKSTLARGGGGGHPKKFYTGRIYHFDRISTPFVYLLLKKGTPFIYLHDTTNT